MLNKRQQCLLACGGMGTTPPLPSSPHPFSIRPLAAAICCFLSGHSACHSKRPPPSPPISDPSRKHHCRPCCQQLLFSLVLYAFAQSASNLRRPCALPDALFRGNFLSPPTSGFNHVATAPSAFSLAYPSWWLFKHLGLEPASPKTFDPRLLRRVGCLVGNWCTASPV